jgi:hypothetical protein
MIAWAAMIGGHGLEARGHVLRELQLRADLSLHRRLRIAGPISGLSHFVSRRLSVARATACRVTAFGLEFSNVGKNGHSAPFAWNA